jgi:hypothetical protein
MIEAFTDFENQSWINYKNLIAQSYYVHFVRDNESSLLILEQDDDRKEIVINLNTLESLRDKILTK